MAVSSSNAVLIREAKASRWQPKLPRMVSPQILWLLKTRFTPPSQYPWRWIFKRSLDIVASGLGLILLFPLFAVVALLIKLDSPGPVLVRQVRVGYRGQLFEMLKFRSMVVNAADLLDQLKAQNETCALMFKMHHDPRITRVGRVLRKYSLDELPQLWNVLTGKMSLVGPRPPLPSEVKDYEPHHWVRFLTVPGITGNWQVHGRSNVKDFEQVCRLDSDYIYHWSVGLDIQLLFKTIPVVLHAKGAC